MGGGQYEEWIKTVARELTNCEDGFLKNKKYLIMDRDATFSKSFRACLRHEGVECAKVLCDHFRTQRTK